MGLFQKKEEKIKKERIKEEKVYCKDCKHMKLQKIPEYQTIKEYYCTARDSIIKHNPLKGKIESLLECKWCNENCDCSLFKQRQKGDLMDFRKMIEEKNVRSSLTNKGEGAVKHGDYQAFDISKASWVCPNCKADSLNLREVESAGKQLISMLQDSKFLLKFKCSNCEFDSEDINFTVRQKSGYNEAHKKLGIYYDGYLAGQAGL